MGFFLRRNVTAMILLGGVSVLTPSAQAFEGLFPTSRYLSARAAALGEAYLPIGDDGPSALFSNPAGFGHLKAPHFDAADIILQTNTDYISTADLNFWKVTGLQGYRGVIGTNPGTYPGVGSQFYTGYSMRGLGFGLLGRAEMAGKYDSATDSFTYRSKYQLIPAVGGGLRLASGILCMGYSLQWVNESSGEVTGVSNSTATLAYTSGIRKGSGISQTLGASLTIPWDYLPRFDVVARNFLNTTFGSSSILNNVSNTSGVPATEQMTYDGSFMVQPKMGEGLTMRWSLVWRDFLNAYGSALWNRLSTGIEFDFRNSFFLRAGYGSGYPSAGIGFRRRNTDFVLTWYTFERGTTFRADGDTRFLLQYQFRAF